MKLLFWVKGLGKLPSCRGCIRIVENDTETTIQGLGLRIPDKEPNLSYRSTGDNGKEHGNYYSILVLYRDNGKEHGSYYSISGLYRDNRKWKLLFRFMV